MHAAIVRPGQDRHPWRLLTGFALKCIAMPRCCATTLR